MTYYANYKCKVSSSIDLLKKPQGDGQCGAWTSLFLDLRKVHGIRNDDEYLTVTAGAEEILVNNWKFNGAGGSQNASYPYMNVPAPIVPIDQFKKDTEYVWIFKEVTDEPGLRGQGPIENPASFFSNHQLAKISGKYYDPSYGLDYEDLEELEESIAGFLIKSFGIAGGEVKEGFLIRKNLANVDLEEFPSTY